LLGADIRDEGGAGNLTLKKVPAVGLLKGVEFLLDPISAAFHGSVLTNK